MGSGGQDHAGIEGDGGAMRCLLIRAEGDGVGGVGDWMARGLNWVGREGAGLEGEGIGRDLGGTEMGWTERDWRGMGLDGGRVARGGGGRIAVVAGWVCRADGRRLVVGR